MMGINLILDSLLAQAAKGAGAVPSERSQFHVNRTQGNEAVRELHSDSRLNDSGGKYAKVKAAYEPRAVHPSPSTVTTLNEAARTIANVLMKYPQGMAPPFLRLQPLNLAQLVWPEQIAQHLKSQLVSSGLFYESHLNRWLNGDYSLEALKAEPQFRGFAGGDQEKSSYALPPGQRLVTAEDRQHYMIRHQLELISHACLRLEGHLAPGYPVTILLQRSYESVALDHEPEEVGSTIKGEVWHGLMRLEHPSFNYVDYEVQITGSCAHVRMMAVSTVLLEYFRRDENHFHDQFKMYGLTQAQFTRIVVTRVSERQPLKLPTPVSANAYVKASHSTFEQEYGRQADRVREHAIQRKVAVNMGPELLGLLMKLDMDKAMPECMFAVLGDLVSWTAAQTLYLEN